MIIIWSTSHLTLYQPWKGQSFKLKKSRVLKQNTIFLISETKVKMNDYKVYIKNIKKEMVVVVTYKRIGTRKPEFCSDDWWRWRWKMHEVREKNWVSEWSVHSAEGNMCAWQSAEPYFFMHKVFASTLFFSTIGGSMHVRTSLVFMLAHETWQ